YIREGRWTRRDRILTGETAEDLVLLVPIPVEAPVALIPSLHILENRDIVIRQAGGLRRRVSLHQLDGNRIPAILWNQTARERIANEARRRACGGARRYRVEDIADTGEVAAAHAGAWNRADLRPFLSPAESFVIAEEEQLVGDDSSAECAAELVLPVRRLGEIQGREVIPCVQLVIAQKLVGRAVPLICARFCDDIDRCAGIAALVRSKHIRLDLEFA